MEKSKIKLSVRLTESAMMIALGVILSLVKLADLPAGGSITLASMLPVMLIAYRYGTLWGMFTGLVYGAIQAVLSTSAFSYVTGAASVIAVLLLDYVLAFMAIGLGGLTRKMKNQRSSLVLASLIVCVVRYACHVLSGATVWAGISIPTASALAYSFVYNATYMIPEFVILVIVTFYIASAVNFRSVKLSSVKKDENAPSSIPMFICGAVCGGALIFDIVSVFGRLQGEDGTFDILGINSVNWVPVIIVTAAAILISAVIIIIRKAIKK